MPDNVNSSDSDDPPKNPVYASELDKDDLGETGKFAGMVRDHDTDAGSGLKSDA